MVTTGKMNMRVDNKEVRYIDINKVLTNFTHICMVGINFLHVTDHQPLVTIFAPKYNLSSVV